jgi:N-ATPase, AtpR subunit
MTGPELGEFAGRTVIFAGLGLALGIAFFAALRLNVRLYLARCRPMPAILLHMTRLGGLAAALVLAAQHGAAAILGTLAGLLLARSVSLRGPSQ